jgi:hypothetical protein
MPNPQIALSLWPHLLPKPKLVRGGVQRIEDSNHARAYRGLRSPPEMGKLLNRRIVEQDRISGLPDYNDVVPYANVATPAFRICRLDWLLIKEVFLFYSSRKVLAGSIRATLRAGAAAARTVTAESVRTTANRVGAS